MRDQTECFLVIYGPLIPILIISGPYDVIMKSYENRQKREIANLNAWYAYQIKANNFLDNNLVMWSIVSVEKTNLRLYYPYVA